MKALIIAAIVLIFYNFSLAIRNIYCFFLSRKFTEGILAILFLLGVPLLIYRAALIPEGNLRIWAGAFIIVLGVIWMVFGIFLDADRKNRSKKSEKQVAMVKKGWQIFLQFAISILIWCYGAFFGIRNTTLRNILLTVTIFVFLSAVFSLWKRLKYFSNNEERNNEVL